MEGGDVRNRTDPAQAKPKPDTWDSCTQTDSRVQGHRPRLSKVNLFTLLSLWMELFPQGQPEEDGLHQVGEQSPRRKSKPKVQPDSSVPVTPPRQINGMGLVVVRDSRVVGLHCSGPELHAGQAAIIQHGASLADCQLYFSRRPCATCLKMIINAGVDLISFWPGDPEVSLLGSVKMDADAALDTQATAMLKSNSRPNICVRLQPLAPRLAQFADETSRDCEFMKRVKRKEPELTEEELFNSERLRHKKDFFSRFLVESEERHKDILKKMGLEHFCLEPFFSNLRSNMTELVGLLATVAAGLPRHDYGFYREENSSPETSRDKVSPPPHPEGVSQEVARHCMIQAQLLCYRTEDPKSGVGAVIWSKPQSAVRDGAGFLGCGYNAYPAGSQYADYPQSDHKDEVRARRKYRYIVHAEQNALTFMKAPNEREAAMLFVTKCPCDECVPLIRGAGITHIYTSDLDRDKEKEDISYLMFSGLKNISKFIWQRSPTAASAPSSRHANGFIRKCSSQADESHSGKKLCTGATHSSSMATSWRPQDRDKQDSLQNHGFIS